MNEPNKLSREEIDRLGDDIAMAAAHIDAATHQLLSSIRRFDETGGWAWQGARSTAHWLNWRIGIGLCAAREQVRVARALVALPLIDAALARGELSYAKVRAMTRVATPENQELLLIYAQSSTGAQLERICRGLRQVTRRKGQSDDDERWVRRRHLPSGMVRIEAQLLPDEAEIVMTALAEARRAARSPNDTAEAQSEGPTLADGFLLAAESFLARGAETRSGAERTQLCLHVQEDRLANDQANFRALLPDGTSLCGATFFRLACDAGLVIAKVDASGSVLDIGRRSRTIPPAIERALWIRDGGCCFPGCGARAHCESHHIEHWSLGGPTALHNLCKLCHYHHVLIHEGGFTIDKLPNGTLVFLTPDGCPIAPVPAAPRIEAPDALFLGNASRGLIIEPRTNLSRWDGTPLGRETLGSAVSALLPKNALDMS